MPSDAGFTHSTMARSYFFDGGPGVMISTGYLANAIAGAFPRASSRLWEVFKANYGSKSRVSDLEDTGSESTISLEVDCKQFLELRANLPTGWH